jgi:predicted DCC family thiol-disulfide oxidoreductase YuxK
MTEHPIVLFDGVCGFCNEWVDYVLARDRGAVFRFATLQSDFGRRRLREAGLPEGYADSILLVDESGTWVNSTAALRVLARLGGIHRLARWLLLLPRPLRDAVYAVGARYRYAWFGKRETCRLPTPEERDRFLG